MASVDTAHPDKAVYNPFLVAVNVFVAPAAAFKSLDSRPTFLFPLALLIISSVAAYSWYFAVVDYSWLSAHMIVR